MNTVWNSYGQLLQLPEKTSKKMQIFCRGLDIRVADVMNSYLFYFAFHTSPCPCMIDIRFDKGEYPVRILQIIKL